MRTIPWLRPPIRLLGFVRIWPLENSGPLRSGISRKQRELPAGTEPSRICQKKLALLSAENEPRLPARNGPDERNVDGRRWLLNSSWAYGAEESGTNRSLIVRA